MNVFVTLVFCLLANANVCQEVRSDEPAVGLAMCEIHGQILASEWLPDHPKWTLKAVRCRIGDLPKEEDV